MSGRRSTKQKRSAWRRRARELRTVLEQTPDADAKHQIILALAAISAKLGFRP